ncbi:MAG: transcription antitermination factor NusB, partial [Pseudomonadota bacterium]
HIRDDVPARVVINEYLDIAHAFFSGEEPKVVNGVLDRLARKVRSAEFDRTAIGEG